MVPQRKEKRHTHFVKVSFYGGGGGGGDFVQNENVPFA